MEKLNRRKTAAAAAVACCLALAAGGTFAYFTDSAKVHNVVTSGGVGIQIVEKSLSDDGALVDFPEGGIAGVMPGQSVSKIVSVRNSDSAEAWVRVRIGQAVVAADGGELPLVIGGEPTDDGAVKGGTSVMSFDLGEGWQPGGDGWCYCVRPVAGGGATGALFERIGFSALMGNEYRNCTANVVVEAQAVQTANNGATVWEARGWPDGGQPGTPGGDE